MGTTATLSLIVPVYNVAPFLPDCMASLAALTPAPDEIIVVDDGSTDDCPRILAEWQTRMPNLRIIRQENGGLSAARNTGLDVARGQYIAFVDSDDFVEPDAYARMLALAEADQLDMVVANAWFHFEGREPDRLIYPDMQDHGVLSGEEWMLKQLENNRLLHMVWMHLYRHDFIKTSGLRFIPRLIHEDVLWTTEALLKARRVRSLTVPVYHYRIRVRPMNAEQRDQAMLKLVDSSVINAQGLARFTDATNEPKLKAQLAWQAVDGGFSVFHKLEQVSDAQRRAASASSLLQQHYCRLLWQHAHGWKQKRRILRHYLKLWLWSCRT